tara:strand:+ start:76 stop:555 length:480 start_codon:yes stop_codon:yes gene_type:complete
MSIHDNFEKIFLNLTILANEVWQLAIFQSNFQDNTLIVIIWAIVLYFVGLFITFYVLKIIIEGILKFILNPITLLFLIFIFGLFVWTITQLDNYENLSEQKFEQSSKNISTVKIEKIAPLEDNKNLKDDQAISENLKKIKRLEEMIKKQQATIKVLKSN